MPLAGTQRNKTYGNADEGMFRYINRKWYLRVDPKQFVFFMIENSNRRSCQRENICYIMEMRIRSGRFNTGGSMLCSSNLKQDVAADCDLYRFHLKSQRTFGMCSVAILAFGILWRSWEHLLISRGHVGRFGIFWAVLGTDLVASWAHFGSSWGCFGNFLGVS